MVFGVRGVGVPRSRKRFLAALEQGWVMRWLVWFLCLRGDGEGRGEVVGMRAIWE